jgi:hypothetical protein
MTNPTLSSLLLAAAALVQVVPAAAQTKGVVMVADLRGSATLGDKTPLALMAEIPAGGVVTLAKDAKITFVNMKTGAESSFTGPGKLTLDPTGTVTGLAPKSQRQVAALKGANKLKPGAMAQASVVMRAVPGSEEPAVTPTGLTLSATPEFLWKSAGPKASYHFKLQDPQGQVLFELTQDECSVQVPEHLALADDTAYTWVLATDLPNGTTTRKTGTIRVYGPKEDRTELQAARPATDSPFTDRVVYAMLLETNGLHEDARVYWKALAKERPEDPQFAKFANH